MPTAGNPATHDPSDGRGLASRKKWLVVLVAAVVVLTMSAGALILAAVATPQLATRSTYTVSRGDLVVTVKEQGTLESSKNTEIKCEIRGGYGGRGGHSTVTWVIPSGTVVEEGAELVRLDTKIIEETVSLGKTDTNNAHAALARAKADLANAQLAVDGYLQGRFRSRMQALDQRKKIATRNLATAQTAFSNAEKLFEQGYVTELEVESNGFVVKQAELELEVVETEIDVLSRLTKAMDLERLNGQVTATKSRVAGREAGVRLEQGRLDLAEVELGKCVIRAPQSGLVIYPSTAKWKNAPDITEGASVHNNQVLLLMPDLQRMQVKIGIHESIISRVKPGMPVKVTLPDRTLETDVALVAAVASPAGWWTGNEVRYDATIELPSVAELRPGMTADVEVTIARHEDVLFVPVETILETAEGLFCWVESETGVQRRSVELGDSNDTSIIVESGLEAGDVVVIDPLTSVAEAREMVSPTLVHTVTRGDLVVTLTEQGTLESSNNTKIKCQVRGASTVNWVIESGTEVEVGDELLRLENKQIEEFLHEREKYAHLSRDAAIGFRADATVAGLAISEYLEGRFRTQLMSLQKDQAVAESSLRTARHLLQHTEMLAEGGYASELEVEEREFAVKQANLELEVIQNEIDVLNKFTKEEELETLKGNWEAAKAAANGHDEVFSMDEARIALARKEMERCVIKAERSGLVIYPTSEEWKDAPDITEGATVHHDQVVLLMPDLAQMQVKFGVHESIIEQLRPGMTAIVTLPEQTLGGEVTSIASAAEPSGWWTGNMVKYDALVELPAAAGLKPGMTAEVKVIMAEHKDVLTVPIAAIVETDEGHFCWVGSPDHAEKRPVVVGASNDSFIIVQKGLAEGDPVVLDPTTFVAP